MDLHPGLLAAADQVYAEMLDTLGSLDGLLQAPADFADEFGRRLEARVGPQPFCAQAEPESEDRERE